MTANVILLNVSRYSLSKYYEYKISTTSKNNKTIISLLFLLHAIAIAQLFKSKWQEQSTPFQNVQAPPSEQTETALLMLHKWVLQNMLKMQYYMKC